MKKLLLILLLSISSTSSVYADFADGWDAYENGHERAEEVWNKYELWKY